MFRQIQPPLTAAEVVELCRAHAAARTFVVARAAAARLHAGGVGLGDVCHVLAHASASACVPEAQDDDGNRVPRWAITGETLDGETVTLMLAFDGFELAVV